MHTIKKPSDIPWTGSKEFKSDILKMLDIAITEKNIEQLQLCIAAAFRDGVDADYSEKLLSIILDTWHEEHEDLVDLITELKDERFCAPLLEIALNQVTYRKFDDENEATLRKCVHALKAIDTRRSREALEMLIKTNNPNVQYTLDIYN